MCPHTRQETDATWQHEVEARWLSFPTTPIPRRSICFGQEDLAPNHEEGQEAPANPEVEAR